MRMGMSRVGGGFSFDQRERMIGQVAGEGIQPAARRAELVAVLVVVALEPAGARAEDEAALAAVTRADVVDGAGHVGLQVRVAVTVAVDQCTELHTAVCSASAASMVHDSKCRPSGSPDSGKKWSQLNRMSMPSSSSSAAASRSFG
jgi:hypothetical protein